MDEYKTIINVDEITEEDVLKNTRYKSIYSNRWFQIEKEEDGYSVYGWICGEMPTFITIGAYVKYWKTLNGIKRAIKRFSNDGGWGFQTMFPQQTKKD